MRLNALVLALAVLSPGTAAAGEPDAGPGCSVAVFRNGVIVSQRQFGSADVENGLSIGPVSAFNIGSISKQFTAMAVLLLQRDGKLSIDDDVHRFLPELPQYRQRLTLRHLLNHTGGVRDYEQLLLLAGWHYGGDEITNQQALDAIFRQRGLNFSPGSEFLYSNSDYVLLAEIVRRVSGQPFEVFLQERIFAPLHMTATYVMTGSQAFIPNRAQGYADARTRISWAYFTLGDGSIVTTAADLAKWDENFYHPVVGDELIIGEMTAATRLTDGSTSPYGFALYNLTYRGEKVVEHDGGYPGFSADLMRFPQRHTSVAVLCNSSSIDPTSLARQTADSQVLPPPRPASSAAQARPVIAGEEFRRFTGSYWSDTEATSRTFEIRAGRLVWVRTDGNTQELEVVDDHSVRFGPARLIVFGMDGSFVETPQGEAGQVLGSRTRYEFRRMPPPDTDLRSFAGFYCSSELDARWLFVVRDGQLVLKRPRFSDEPLKAIFKNGFKQADANLLFHAHGLTATNILLRTVEFEKCH